MYLTTIIIYACLIILPLTWAFIQLKILPHKNPSKVYANYFLGITIGLPYFVLGWIYIFCPMTIANNQQWTLSPIFQEYGILIIAFACSCFFAMLKSSQFKAMLIVFLNFYLLFIIVLDIIHLNFNKLTPEQFQGSVIEIINNAILIIISWLIYRKLIKNGHYG